MYKYRIPLGYCDALIQPVELVVRLFGLVLMVERARGFENNQSLHSFFCGDFVRSMYGASGVWGRHT